MGVDLTLIPVESDMGNWLYAPSLIEFGRWYDLYEQIEKMPQVTHPGTLHSYRGRNKDGDSAYGQTLQTPYGDPIKYVKAGDLARLDYTVAEVGHRTAAAINYVRALEPDTLVALYWH